MKKGKTIILALFSCLLWGLVFPTLQLVYGQLYISNDFAKITLAGMRFFSAGILVLLYYILTNKKFPKITSGNMFGKLTLLGTFQTTLLYAFFFIGSSNTSGVKSAVLSQADIFFVVVSAHFLLKGEKMSVKKTMALILGFVGMIVVNVNSFGSNEALWAFALEGEGYLLISGVFAAIGTIIAKRIGKNIDPVLMNGWQLTLGGGLLLITGIVNYGQLIVFPNTYAFLLFLALVLISAIAFTIWYRILKNVKASEITIYKFTVPIIGAISSALIVPGENISSYTFIGLILVSIGVYLTNKQ